MIRKQLQARVLEARVRGFNQVRIDDVDKTSLDEWQAASAMGLGVLSVEKNACELEWIDYHHLRSMVNGPQGIATGKMWSFGRNGTHKYESFPMQVGQHDWRVCIRADGTDKFYQWRAADSDIWHDQERWPTYDAQQADHGLPREVKQKLWPREQMTVQRLLGRDPLPEPAAAPLPEPVAPLPKKQQKPKAKPKRKVKRAPKIRALVRTTTRPASLH